jgi:hypothetical protein
VDKQDIRAPQFPTDQSCEQKSFNFATHISAGSGLPNR